MRSCACVIFVALAAGQAVLADLPELPPDYERYARGVVERSGVKPGLLGDETEALTRAVSIYRQMQRRGEKSPQLSIDMLLQLARAYANGVQPMLLGRRHLLEATAADLFVEDAPNAGPGNVAERMAIWNQMLTMSQRVLAAGGPDAQEQARTLGVGALLMIATDVPDVAFVFIVRQPSETIESLRAANVNVDAMREWADQSFPGRDVWPEQDMRQLARAADLLIRGDRLDPEHLRVFTRLARRVWPEVQRQVTQPLMLCHFAYGVRLSAEHANDQGAVEALRELSEDLAKSANCKVHEKWARQIADLPVVDRRRLEFPRVSQHPYDNHRDPP